MSMDSFAPIIAFQNNDIPKIRAFFGFYCPKLKLILKYIVTRYLGNSNVRPPSYPMTWEYNLFLSCVSETFKDYSSVTYHIMLWKNLSGYVTQPRNPQSTTSSLYLSDQESQLTRKEQDGKQRNSIGDVWQVFRILYNLHTMRWNGATVCGSMGLVESSKIKWLAQKSKITYNGHYTYFDSI